MRATLRTFQLHPHLNLRSVRQVHLAYVCFHDAMLPSAVIHSIELNQRTVISIVPNLPTGPTARPEVYLRRGFIKR